MPWPIHWAGISIFRMGFPILCCCRMCCASTWNRRRQFMLKWDVPSCLACWRPTMATLPQHLCRQFSQRVARMPYAQTLRQAGIPRSELPLLASEAMKVQRLLDHNPRPIGYEDALAIYQAAF